MRSKVALVQSKRRRKAGTGKKESLLVNNETEKIKPCTEINKRILLKKERSI